MNNEYVCMINVKLLESTNICFLIRCLNYFTYQFKVQV